MAATLMNLARRSTLRRVRVPYTGQNQEQGSAVPQRRKPITAAKPDELPARFAEWLRKTMEDKGWKAKDVAALLAKEGLDIGPRGIDVWLRAEGSPKFRDLEKIGRALGFADYRDMLPAPLPKKAAKPR
jgi:hypothetical protein